MKNEERIANEIFKRYGVDFQTAVRAETGWTNAVWLSDDFALRLALTQNSDRIRRETERSKILPSAVGYPINIVTGITDGYEWSLSKRVRGKVLSSVWDGLSLTEKAKAVKQIFDIMNSVHSTDFSEFEHQTSRQAWYNSFDKNKSLADIDRYVKQNIFTSEQGRIMGDILNRFYKYHNSVTRVFNHGDITTDNLLWHDGNVVSLLDFEHSVIASRQLDLHAVINIALIWNKINFKTEDEAVKEYIKDMKNLFKPLLSQEYEFDLLLGYAVLFCQRFLEFWLEEPEGELDQCDAYQKLLSLIDGNGGYMAELLNM